MKRIESLVKAHSGTHKELVKAIAHSTCLQERQVYDLVNGLALEKEVLRISSIPQPERIQPSIYIESLGAPDPVALAKQAIEEGWTAEQTRQAARKLKATQQNGHMPIPPPHGSYRTIVMDPPWKYGNVSGRQRPEYAENLMTREEIAQFGDEKFKEWVPDGYCHLYLWTTDAFLLDALLLVRGWGFTIKTTLVWVKDRFGMGNYYRHQHELCLFATQGKQRLKRKNASTVLYAPITKHLEKPDAFYDLVESCSYEPYLDVFARKQRPGWAVYGDEVNETYQLRLEGDNASTVVG